MGGNAALQHEGAKCRYAYVDESDPSTGYCGGYVATSCGCELDDGQPYQGEWICCPFCGRKIEGDPWRRL